MKSIIMCLLFIMGFSSGTVMAGDIIIVGNKGVPDAELSQKDVRKMFLGKLRLWSDGSNVHPAVIGIPAIHELFIKQYLKKSTGQYNAYWKRMIFTGRGLPPKSFKTEIELIDFVAETEGAVAYVTSGSIPDGAESKIRIIKIRDTK